MPPKTRISSEMIIDGAFRLIREKGYESLNARSLSSFLSCSTQPILYHFSSMDEVRDRAYERADEFHTAYLMTADEEEDNPLLSLGLRYIRFAYRERNLFLFLFQSGKFRGKLSLLFEDPNLSPVLKEIGEATGLGEKDIKRLFFPLFSAIHGNASLLANNSLEYDEEETKEMLVLLFEGLMERIRGKDNE